MTEPIIKLKSVCKSFGSNQVLNQVNLDILPNQITVILGKSGVGKSVLLKHIVGLLKPDSGEVSIEGKELWHMNQSQRKAMLDKISYLFQGTALFDSMTVYENISLPLAERTRMKTAEINEKVHKVSKLLDLYDVDDKYPSQLSGGMRKRVALARALVTQPEILLFDEPTTGLDPVRVVSVLKMIHDYHTKLGFTGVLVSHAIPEILYITQRVAFLHQGCIIFQGSVEQLLEETNPPIREFFATQDIERMNCNLQASPVDSWQVDQAWSGTRAG
jgi:phospholipid/cholesterol/gamma-HCH transport system ATP-binding protein